jgi:hypothetical protein
MHQRTRLQLSFGVFFVALVTLMVELLLIRVFDVILVRNLGYMVISCALFAFGLAGVYATLRPVTEVATVDRRLAWLGFALAAACAVQLPLLNLNPFDLRLAAEAPARQMVWFGLIYLTVSLPFFFAGLILATVFSVYAGQIRRLYFFDLVGAAIGAVIIVPLVRPLGPDGLLFVAAALALIAAALFGGRRGQTVIAGALAAACLTVPLTQGDGYYDFRPHLDKRGVLSALRSGAIERSIWDPVSKIDVFPVVDPDRGPGFTFKHVAYDGGSQSTWLFPFDGDFTALRQRLSTEAGSDLRNFTSHVVPLAHWFKADTGAEVLVIGSAGGQETKAALTYGASHVDAIELVGAVVDLTKGPYSDYIGGVFRDPRVDSRVGEGRSFLRGTDKLYDIIQIYSNYTTSSISSGNGAAAADYLQTTDAYMEYFRHLKNDGILQINHYGYPRMITTAGLAWQRLGRTDFRKHVVVYEADIDDDTLPTLLVKMTPWTADQLQRLNTHMQASDPKHKYLLMENPLDPAASFLSDAFYDQPQSSQLMDAVDYIVRPATDGQPYFNFLRRHLGLLEPNPDRYLDRGTAFVLNAPVEHAGLPFDLVHFFVTGLAAVVFALIFVFVPLLLAPAGRRPWPNKATTIFYFSCLGAGFIIIELTLIQIFMKLVGFPLYTYSTVIFTMLLAAGLGSLSAERLEISPQRRWMLPFIALVLYGLALWAAHSALFGVLLAAPLAARVLIAGAMIFPLGFFMGMPLPLGILAIAQQPQGAVAWAWAMNGLFTVIGGLATALGSIYLGFNMVLLIGFAIYVVAGLAFRRLRRTQALAGSSTTDRDSRAAALARAA